MHIKIKRLLRPLKAGWVAVLVFMVAGCEWGDRTITLIRPDTDNLQVTYTDTVTVLRSTVMKDSLYTGNGLILAGSYRDLLLGLVEAKGYLLPSASAGISLEERAVYDSLVLATRYSYSYGDTTQRYQLSVHELLEDITRASYYNHRATAYEKAPVATTAFFARRKTGDWLRLRMSDNLGQKLFSEAKANNIKTQEALLKYFKGVALVTDHTNDAGFLGYAKDSTTITLHYHVDGPDGKTKHSTALSIGQFYNQIVNDRSGTAFEGLVTSRNSLSSTLTDDVTVIQSGAGLMTRIDFPFIHQFGFDQGKVIVNRAFLRIQLPRNPEVPFMSPPEGIAIYTTGANNDWDASSSQLATGAFVNDIILNERYYQVDVSSLIMQMVQEKAKSPYGFLLGPLGTSSGSTSSTYTTSVDRLVLPKNSVKLQVYYTTMVE